MSDKPILFSGPMVRAILDGRKTMTRQVAMHRHDGGGQCEHTIASGTSISRHCEHGSGYTTCPYSTGDRLWVRETWRPLWDDIDSTDWLGDCIQYKADMAKIKPRILDEDTGFKFDAMCVTGCTDPKWKTSIHMPRWASRIALKVTGVRVERLQDISEKDAKAEGIGIQKRNTLPDGFGIHDNHYRETAKLAFMDLWDSINAKRGFGWDVNPWVWVVEFRRAE